MSLQAPFRAQGYSQHFSERFNDVLRKESTCFVGDVTIFSKTQEDHIEHIVRGWKNFRKSNIRTSRESRLFKTIMEYLRFTVFQGGKRYRQKNYVLENDVRPDSATIHSVSSMAYAFEWANGNSVAGTPLSPSESTQQILQDYLFQKMTKPVNEVVANCKVCLYCL